MVLLVFEVINDQIESRLGEDVEQRGEYLKGVFAISEDNEVVSEQVEIVEEVAGLVGLLQDSHLLFGDLTVVHLVLITAFKVCGDDTGLDG